MATLEQAQHDIAVKKGKAEAPAEEAEVVTAEELVETPEDDEGEDAAE